MLQSDHTIAVVQGALRPISGVPRISRRGLVSADRPPRNSPQIVASPAGISQYLATAANAFGHAVERCVLAIDCIVRITHQVFLRGHLIDPRLAVADGASGSNCLSGFVDGSWADGFCEPTVCAIATEVSIRASNATVVISFRISRVGPSNHSW